MTEKTDQNQIDTEMLRSKKHRTREMQYQLERIANMLDQEEPPKLERRRIIATVLREMAQFMEKEYEGCVARLKKEDAELVKE